MRDPDRPEPGARDGGTGTDGRHRRRRLRRTRARHLWLSMPLWRRRLAIWGGAALVGLIAVAFAEAADAVQRLAARMAEAQPLLPFIASPLLFGLATWLARRFFPGSPGSGIPQAIAARHLGPGSTHRRRLLGLQVAGGKIALTLLGLLAGASIGREGPTVQVGAAVMLACTTAAGLHRQRDVVLAGAAAGIAAAFNTPLAGIVFAIEEMARAYESRTSGLVLVAVIIAGMASMATLGNYEYFGHSVVALGFGSGGWLAIVATGVTGGVAGGVFSRVLLELQRVLPALGGGCVSRYPVLFAAACGLVVAGIGVASAGATFGTGYATAREALEGGASLALWYAPAKLVATAVSTLSGIPGGLFAPSLSVGAGVGAAIGTLLPGVPAGAVVMLGMVAYFAGVTQSPITGFVIVMEMTGNHQMLVPLMATALLARGASRMICPVPLYHALAAPIVRAGRAADLSAAGARAPATRPQQPDDQ